MFDLNRKGNLPTFIIIGAMKGGTTSLYFYLKSHPEILMSRAKELNYFSHPKHLNQGIEWYKNQFKGEAKIYGEASPSYTFFPDNAQVPKLIHETLPNVKLIYLVRDPIQRAISHYLHIYTRNIENRTFEEALGNFEKDHNNLYLSRSLYYLQLERYLEYFSLNDILIVSSEDLYKNGEATLKVILKYLDVSEDTSLINFNKKTHQSSLKRRKNELGVAISKLPPMQTLNAIPLRWRRVIDKVIYYPFSAPVGKVVLSDELKERLREFFSDDVSKLRQLTGQDFSSWSV